MLGLIGCNNQVFGHHTNGMMMHQRRNTTPWIVGSVDVSMDAQGVIEKGCASAALPGQTWNLAPVGLLLVNNRYGIARWA